MKNQEGNYSIFLRNNLLHIFLEFIRCCATTASPFPMWICAARVQTVSHYTTACRRINRPDRRPFGVTTEPMRPLSSFRDDRRRRGDSIKEFLASLSSLSVRVISGGLSNNFLAFGSEGLVGDERSSAKTTDFCCCCGDGCKGSSSTVDNVVLVYVRGEYVASVDSNTDFDLFFVPTKLNTKRPRTAATNTACSEGKKVNKETEGCEIRINFADTTPLPNMTSTRSKF